jgi:predicted RNA-binding Zn ribbon-like protein
VNHERPGESDLATLARSHAEAVSRTRLVPGGRGRVRRVVDPGAAGSRLVRLRLAESAAELLTSEQMERVRRCPACGWFFLDTSKNRSRRWCSMATCGASAKSKRYYWRTRPRRARI